MPINTRALFSVCFKENMIAVSSAATSVWMLEFKQAPSRFRHWSEIPAGPFQGGGTGSGAIGARAGRGGLVEESAT